MKKRYFIGAMASCALALTGCAEAPDSSNVTGAIREALSADIASNPQGPKTFADLPIGKSIATNLDDGRQFVIAKKTGSRDAEPNCALFTVTVSRPSQRLNLVPHGDMSSATGQKICTL